MKNIINIFKTDINKIKKNKAAIVVVVALMILPSMYAWFNILPSWDPYANTADVAVAVVNNDEGATAEGKSFNVGNEVVDSLQENTQLGWTIVDEDEALDGVEKGKFYASIVIPQDFSKKLTSILDEKPEKPVLIYYINDKINAIAPKVTNAGASGIVEGIQTGFVKVTNETIFSVFNDIGIELETNRGEIERFRDTIYELEKELPEIKLILDAADEDIVKVENALVRVNDGMERAAEISKEAEKVSGDIESKIDKGNSAVRKYIPKAKEDLQFAQNVIKQAPDLIDNTIDIGDDVDLFLNKVIDSTKKVDTAVVTLDKLIKLLEDVDERIIEERELEKLNEKLNDELLRLNNLQKQLDDSIAILESGNHVGVDIVKSIIDKVNEIEAELIYFTDVLNNQIVPAIEQLAEQLRNINENLDEKLNNVKDKNEEAIKKVDEWIAESPLPVESQLNILKNIKSLIETELEIIEDRITALKFANDVKPDPAYESAIETLEIIEKKLNNILGSVEEAYEKAAAGEDLTEDFFPILKEALEEVNSKIDNLIDRNDEINSLLEQSISKLTSINEELQNNLNTLQILISEVKEVTEKLETFMKDPQQLISALQKLSGLIGETQQVLESIININKSLQDVFDDGLLLSGRDHVLNMKKELIYYKEEIIRLSNNLRNNKDKAIIILKDIKSLSIKIDGSITDFLKYIDTDLMPKYEQAAKKASNAISEGNKLLDKANSYFPKINELIGNVDEGIGKGKDGLGKAHKYLPEVEGKVKDIANKIRQLERQGDLDKIINLMKNDPTAESDFLADPIFLEEHELFAIPNYGSGMAPFFTAMSIWVGGLILVSSLIVDVPNKQLYKSYEAYFGRFLLFWIIGIMQSFIVTMGNMFLLKTYVAHEIMYVLFGFIISTTFIVIIYTLVSVFGNTGKVIAIILLVMQLGASGGTFPIQMTPSFFQKIHNFLPFTHALGLFREAVGGIIWPVVLKHLAWLAGYVAVFLFIGIRLKESINKRSDKFLEEARESDVIL